MEIEVEYTDINNGEDFKLTVDCYNFVPGDVYIVAHETDGAFAFCRTSQEIEDTIFDILDGWIPYDNVNVSLSKILDNIKIARVNNDVKFFVSIKSFTEKNVTEPYPVEEKIADTTQQIADLVAKLQDLQGQRNA